MIRKEDPPIGVMPDRGEWDLAESFGGNIAEARTYYVNAGPSSLSLARKVLSVALVKGLKGPDHPADRHCEDVRVFEALLEAVEGRLEAVQGRIELVTLGGPSALQPIR